MIRLRWIVLLLSATAWRSEIAAADCPPITPSSLWKNAIEFPDEPFAVQGAGGELPTWIKFTILTCDPSVVYFQDSNQYSFHYDFAVNELDPFAGLTREQYDLISLHAIGQEAILGAVLYPGWDLSNPPAGGFPQEFGIQLVRQDAYTPQEVVDLFNAVRTAVNAAPGAQAYYFPTFEQMQTALANQAFLEANGVFVSSADRWAAGNACYAEGWAIGLLNFVPGQDIDAEYIAGTLEPGDILLTDAVPASVPFLAGILTLSPSTPNSHVAILSSTFGVPFVHLALAGDEQDAQNSVGDRVLVRAASDATSGRCEFTLVNVEGVLDEQTIADLLALKQPPVLNITPTATFGAYSASTAGLQPSDIQFFGGKAANFGLLRQAIPNNSPKAAALSFDLWNDFLDQTLTSGLSLRQEIDALLSGYTWPPDFAALADDLDTIRDMIKDEDATQFSQSARDAVIETLQRPQFEFDANLRIRFRSSTNVEDSENFSGAGLYDSNSGCLADDLDADEIGPSHCDPTDPDEDGVFRSIRRVFDSFYHDNAFLERLRHGVDESQVGMAVLVHHSFPDEIELANGVATYFRTPFDTTILFVTQAGAVSVTEPEPDSIPEEVRMFIWNFPSPPEYEILTYSNLVQLGDTVLTYTGEYEQLRLLLDAVAAAFEQATGESDYILDFEYKKMAAGGGELPAGGLVVKQVRQVPQPDDVPSMSPFLINEPVEYEVFQGEWNNTFSIHRLKTRLNLETQNLWLTPESLEQSFYADVDFTIPADCRLQSQTGALPTLPGAFHSFGGSIAADGWEMVNVNNPRTYRLLTPDPEILVPPSQPLITQRDIFFGSRILEVTYANAVPTDDIFKGPETTTESVRLYPRRDPEPGDVIQQRTLVGPNGVVAQATFYWPKPPTGIIAGYTAPLVAWVDVVIEGLTTDPLVLQDYYALTYRPWHHNFAEEFILDPWLEPTLTPQQRAELAAQNIRLLHVLYDLSTQFSVFNYYSNAELLEACSDLIVEGDMNCDGSMDARDIGPFVEAILDPSAYLGRFPFCSVGNGDTTGDEVTDADDVSGFVTCLLNGGCS